MRFSTAFAAATALFSTVSASDISFKTYLSDSEEAQTVSSMYEGAGLAYLFVSEGGADAAVYDSASGKIVKEVTSGGKFAYNMTLGIVEGSEGFPFLEFSTQDNSIWWFVDHVSKLGAIQDGQKVEFYAAKNASDPENYSKDAFFLGATSANLAGFTGTSGLLDLQTVDISVDFA